MAGKLNNKKVKTGICEIHKFALEEDKRCLVRWDVISNMWMCKNCEKNVVLQAMAATGRKQLEYFNKINKQHQK